MTKRMTGILGVFVATALLAAIGYGDSGLSVVLPDAPTVSERFAAGELKYHLEKATGEPVPVVAEGETAAEGRHLYVGHVKALAGVGIDYDGLGVEERVVKGVGGDVYLAGGEQPGFDALVKTAKYRTTYGLAGGGTLYAVYDFLEKDMGVRWIWPGELGEIIPKRAVPVLDGVERRGIEPLVKRELRGNLEGTRRITIANRLWGWKDPANAQREVARRELWLTRHRTGARQTFSFGHAFTAWPKRYRSHPEYFAMQPDGVRGHFADTKPEDDGNRCYPLCVSNPEVQDAIVTRWVRANQAKLQTGLQPSEINCCENDSPGFCTCARCRAWDAADPRFQTHPYWNGTIRSLRRKDRSLISREQWGEDGESIPDTEPPSVTDRYVRFYNTVLERARRVYPQAKVCGYAYSNYKAPPKATRVAEGVVISFVPGIVFPYDQSRSEIFRADWGGWNGKGATRMFYRPNYLYGGGSMPYSQARQMAADINFAYAHGMIAIDQDSLLGAWSAQAMKNYVAARILREPDASYEKMSGEFYAAFGAGASDVRGYCEMLEALNTRFESRVWAEIGAMNRSLNGTPGGGWRNFVMNIADLYSEAWFEQADARLQSAAAKAEGVARARVEFLRKGLRDGLLTYRTRVAQKSGDEAAFQTAFRTMIDYRAQVEADNVCAWAWFADTEWSQAGWPHVTQPYRK